MNLVMEEEVLKWKYRIHYDLEKDGDHPMVAMSKNMELTTLNILNLLIKWRIQEQRQYLYLADIHVIHVYKK